MCAVSLDCLKPGVYLRLPMTGSYHSVRYRDGFVYSFIPRRDCFQRVYLRPTHNGVLLFSQASLPIRHHLLRNILNFGCVNTLDLLHKVVTRHSGGLQREGVAEGSVSEGECPNHGELAGGRRREGNTQRLHRRRIHMDHGRFSFSAWKSDSWFNIKSTRAVPT